MNKRTQMSSEMSQKLTLSEKFVNWLTDGALKSVKRNSLSVQIKGSSVTVDLSSVIGNESLAEQVKAVKN